MSRKTQVYTNDGWTTIDFAELDHGDKFRMFDDGKPVRGTKGEVVFTAKGKPYYNEEVEALTVDIF